MKRLSYLFCIAALVLGTLNSMAEDKVYLLREGYPTAAITSPKSGQLRYAAELLQRYFKEMTGAEVAITDHVLVAEGSPSGIYEIRFQVRAHSLKDDGFHLLVDGGDKLVIEASEPRGCIYGAYALLEQLGCRFYGPEPLGVIIPKVKELSVPANLDIKREPSFAYRVPTGLNREEQLFMGTNSVGFANNDDTKQWLTKTGLRPFSWGHYWPDFVQKKFSADGKWEKMDYAQHEDWLPADKNGKRRANGVVLCFSNDKALDWFAENAATWLMANYKDAAMFNLWPADIEMIDLCRCENCKARDWNQTDWYLHVHNAIYKKLQARGWKGNFGWIAYISSEEVPKHVNLENHGKQMDFMYAPRPRGGTMYGPFTSDASLSVKYRKNLDDWLAYLDRNQFSGSRSVFEYYWDMALVANDTRGRVQLVPTPAVAQQDLQYYKQKGFESFYHCCGGWSVFWPDPLSNWIYYRLLWDVNLDLDAAKKDFYEHYYGPVAKAAQRVREVVEEDMYQPPTYLLVQKLQLVAQVFDGHEGHKGHEGHNHPEDNLDPVTETRLKAFRLWTKYCALAKEGEFHRDVTHEEEKGLDAEDKALALLKDNRDFLLQNKIMSEDNFDTMVSITQWYRSRFNGAIAKRLPFDVAASSEHGDAPMVCAFDGDPNQPWGSGKMPPCWIEAKFRAPREIKGVELFCLQRPDGPTRHEIIIEDAQGERTVKVFEGDTKSGDWLKAEFDPPLREVKRLRVLTTKSTNFVAWGEIVIK